MSSTCPIVDRLESSRGLRFAQIEYPSEFRMPLHCHADATSLDFCLEGAPDEIRDRRTFVQEPTTLTLMPRGVAHANCFPKGARTFLMVWNAEWIEPFPQIAPLIEVPRCCRGGRATWIAARMYREFQHRDGLTLLTLEGMLLELLAEMARDPVSLPENRAPRWIGQATDFLHAHFTQNLSAESIASAVGVHPAHLMRAFRQYHRSTIGEYVRTLRVEYACHLLLTSQAPLGQIALEVGFSDQSHFNRTFKRQVGISPREFLRISACASPRQKVQS